MIKIRENLLRDIEEFCKLNDISDIEKEINKYIQRGFNIEKYGYSPIQKQEIQNTTQEDKKEEENINNTSETLVPLRKGTVRIIKNK